MAWRNAAVPSHAGDRNSPEDVQADQSRLPRSQHASAWTTLPDREDEGVLLVPKAGEMLFHLKHPPKWAEANG